MGRNINQREKSKSLPIDIHYKNDFESLRENYRSLKKERQNMINEDSSYKQTRIASNRNNNNLIFEELKEERYSFDERNERILISVGKNSLSSDY